MDLGSLQEGAESKIVELLDKPQRVHDVVDVTAQSSTDEAAGGRRLLRGLAHAMLQRAPLLLASEDHSLG